jgi:hypothetical protein
MATTIDWTDVAIKVNTIIQTGAPVAELLLPAWAPAIAIAAKVLQGAAAAEPTAVALVKSIQAGTPPTAAQLQSFSTAYEADYQQLHADIAAQLAAS